MSDIGIISLITGNGWDSFCSLHYVTGLCTLDRSSQSGALSHRGLKLDGAIGQGEICNSLKIENFSKSFLSQIGKNKIKFQKK